MRVESEISHSVGGGGKLEKRLPRPAAAESSSLIVAQDGRATRLNRLAPKAGTFHQHASAAAPSAPVLTPVLKFFGPQAIKSPTRNFVTYTQNILQAIEAVLIRSLRHGTSIHLLNRAENAAGSIPP